MSSPSSGNYSAFRDIPVTVERALPGLRVGLAVMPHLPPTRDTHRDTLAPTWRGWLGPRVTDALWVGDLWVCALDVHAGHAAALVERMNEQFYACRTELVRRHLDGTVHVTLHGGRA